MLKMLRNGCFFFIVLNNMITNINTPNPTNTKKIITKNYKKIITNILFFIKIEQHQRQQRKENNEAIFKTKRRIIFETEDEKEEKEEKKKKEEKLVDKANITEEQFQKIQIYIDKEYDHLIAFAERFKFFSQLVKICIDYLQPDNNEQLSQMVNLLSIHKLLKSWVKQVENDQSISIKQKKQVLKVFESDMEKINFFEQRLSSNTFLTKQINNLNYENLFYKKEIQKYKSEIDAQRTVQEQLKKQQEQHEDFEQRLRRHNYEFQIYKDKKIYENSLLEKEILVLKSVIKDLKDQLSILSHFKNEELLNPQLQQLPIIESNILNNENVQFLKNNNKIAQKEKKKQKNNQEFIL
ncbi:hypothetical protein pb186bvf_009031 [Paramecium bursaria]